MENNNRLIIEITGQAPIAVDRELWTLIAEAVEFSGEFEAQADRLSRLSVRQHADGRALVYGEHTTRWQGEQNYAGGHILTKDENLVLVVAEVVAELGFSDSLHQRCLASFPPVNLD